MSLFESRQPFISRSKYLWGLQCPKLLWHAHHAVDLIPPPDPRQEALIDQSRLVRSLAGALFPDGITVADESADPGESVRLTREALKTRRPLFDAAFAANGCYARVDILKPCGPRGWSLVEIRSTTYVKEVHLREAAFHAYVLSSAGLELAGCYFLHLNADYVRHGEIEPDGLFARSDVSDQVRALSDMVDNELSTMSRTIRQRDCPEVQIGPHCDCPNPCPLREQCRAFLPEHNVLDLYRGGKKGLELLAKGIMDIRAIPEDIALTPRQRLQKAAAQTGQPFVDRLALAGFLARLRYPMHFLDFETFVTAIPAYDQVRPFDMMPFQFSLDIVPTPDAAPEHFGFLAPGSIDPRPELMRRLAGLIQPEGSVLAYNAEFERGVLRTCCRFLPQYAGWLARIEPRLVDLLHPFRSFHYYHPRQHGSASLKALLPAITGRGYEDLPIREGNTASLEYLRATFTGVSDEERRLVREQLEAYCGLDTVAMVRIIEALRQLAAT